MTRWVETFKGAVLASEYDAEAYMTRNQLTVRWTFFRRWS
jgi:hypothetical protein